MAHPEFDFKFLTSNTFVLRTIAERGVRHIQARRLPEINGRSNWKQKFDRGYLYPSLLCRFIAINNLSITNIRKEKSLVDRLEYQMYTGFNKGQLVTWPFEKSRVFYNLLYNLRPRIFSPPDPVRLKFLKEISPDLFMIARIHNPETVGWLKALQRLNIKTVGYVASWDQTTTQGPTPKGFYKIAVASSYMKQEMVQYHGISKDCLRVVGKPQMDIFTNKNKILLKKEFFNSIGIKDHSQKMILFGSNVGVLGVHEPSIAKWIVDAISDGNIKNAIFCIRPHPQDKEWRVKFSSILHSKHVVTIKSHRFTESDSTQTGHEDQVLFANLLYHSDLVIQTRGSMALDAFAYDKPVISLAFDGDKNKYYEDSIAREYEYEHYQPLVMQNSTWLVSSMAELSEAIKSYLADPHLHASGREKIRTSHIAPLDGNSGKRIVKFIIDSGSETPCPFKKHSACHSSTPEKNKKNKVSFDIRSYLQTIPEARRNRRFEVPLNNIKELWLKICPYPPVSDSPILLIKRGRAFLLEGQTQKAMICAENALFIEPFNLDALRLKFDILYKLDDFKGALFILGKILQLEPDDAISLKHKVMLLVNLNEAEKAHRAIKTLFKCSQTDASLHGLYYKIGLQLLKKGDRDGAKEIFENIINSGVAQKEIMAWAAFKYGEDCLDHKMRAMATSYFKLALLYNQNHIKAKIYLISNDEPLKVSTGIVEDGCEGLICIPLDDPFEIEMWDYYFDRRKPDYIEIDTDKKNSINKLELLPNLLIRHLSQTGTAVVNMKCERNALIDQVGEVFSHRFNISQPNENTFHITHIQK
ncbi:CDP-glycerol glycerophosphotransferase family protein [Desulfosarcina variabilis]|uniref:CDP-glycerol glycerophosphotransferase family protein n=1 Tax=Desulfosarcina variabilis TaxID=2300 RepID=UPI003AFAFFCB